MAQTATRHAKPKAKNGSPGGKAKTKDAVRSRAKAAPRRGLTGAAKQAASSARGGKGHASVPGPTAAARKLAVVAVKRTGRRMMKAAAEAIRDAAERVAATGAEAVAGGTRAVAEKAGVDGSATGAQRRLPIQRAVDVAVPIRVAWDEWLALDAVPEGVHTVIDIERSGLRLRGRTAGPRASEWSAEIIDERECQSFAWQSEDGSDCAGLVTFHRLSERLTRLELNLDVVPKSVAEAVQLIVGLADHRAETDLRRFKARLELINPDVYSRQAREEPGEDENLDDESDDA